MSTPKKLLLIFIFMILDTFLLIGFLEIRDATMMNQLNKEMDTISQLNMATDRYNSNIQTRGRYAIVEKSIKEYLDDSAILLQDTLKIANDSKFTNILSFRHYEEDGPNFQDSISYLNQQKKTFNENVDSIINRLGEDTIKDYIRTRTRDSDLYKLYEELILNHSMKGELEDTMNLVLKYQTKINTLFDTSLNVLEFLVSNKDSWVLEEGEIRFQTKDLYQKYNQYISQIKG